MIYNNVFWISISYQLLFFGPPCVCSSANGLGLVNDPRFIWFLSSLNRNGFMEVSIKSYLSWPFVHRCFVPVAVFFRFDIQNGKTILFCVYFKNSTSSFKWQKKIVCVVLPDLSSTYRYHSFGRFRVFLFAYSSALIH